jgi:hypothetical protein
LFGTGVFELACPIHEKYGVLATERAGELVLVVLR